MPPVVQAGSLADVMAVADNPPKIPQSRASPDVQQPLVLYIARVPGSKDVFLTTMKPLEKVVTAQDVQSSLYYLHMASPDDERLLRNQSQLEDPQEINEDDQHDADENSHVHRKQLLQNSGHIQGPQTNPVPLSTLPLQSHTISTSVSAQVKRKPVGQVGRPGHLSVDSAPTLPLRKPVGPRSMNQRLHSIDSPLQSAPGRENVDMRRWSEQPPRKPRLPPRSISHGGLELPVLSQRQGHLRDDKSTAISNKSQVDDAEHCWEWEKLWTTRHCSEAQAGMAEIVADRHGSQGAFQNGYNSAQKNSFTLIRRYNGEQLNVAQIYDVGRMKPAVDNLIAEVGMSIEILTPGYSQFVSTRKDERGLQVEGGVKDAIKQAELKEAGNETFRRHLQLSKDAKRLANLQDPDTSEANTGERRWSSLQNRPGNVDSSQTSATEPVANRTSSGKGYTIKTPWNGVCEFVTGLAGRSIKCKHFYTSMIPRFGPGTFSASVSELRFNLPTSKAFGTPSAKTDNAITPRESKRSSYFLRSHHRHTSSFETDSMDLDGNRDAKVELEDRLDLSLGQEHAGGGFGGKQAKLGKLIVEAEGLQMLDLIVAANMALWWKVYEQLT